MKVPSSKRVHPRDSKPVEQKSSVDWRVDVQLVPLGFHWGDIDKLQEHSSKPLSTASIAQHVEYGRRVSMEGAEKADQKRFLEAMLKFKWLSPRLKSAVMRELGLSLRKQQKQINEAIVTMLRVEIEDREALMRKRNERPRGGIHAAAIEQVAAAHGMSVEALEKRLERYPDPEQRRHLKKLARRVLSET